MFLAIYHVISYVPYYQLYTMLLVIYLIPYYQLHTIAIYHNIGCIPRPKRPYLLSLLHLFSGLRVFSGSVCWARAGSDTRSSPRIERAAAPGSRSFVVCPNAIQVYRLVWPTHRVTFDKAVTHWLRLGEGGCRRFMHNRRCITIDRPSAVVGSIWLPRSLAVLGSAAVPEVQHL